MQKRTFLKNLAMYTCSTVLLDQHPMVHKYKKMKKIGIQLFSLPILLENDFRGAIKMLAQMGYRELELYGPFSFSAPSAKERWKAIVPALGFSGSGYFGHNAKEVRSIVKEYAISIPAIHTDLKTLQTRMDQLGEAGAELGFEYVGFPAIPAMQRKTLDDYKRMADIFNKIGSNAKKMGLKFAYHNHGYGLSEMEGQVPLNILLEKTDPNLVFFEMDVFWTTAGGADPLTYLATYPDRYHLMHLKDMKKKSRFSGDGGDPSQWMELFPQMTTAGAGILDLKSIISLAKKTSVKHFFVEQDMVAQPEIALKKSLDYLKSL